MCTEVSLWVLREHPAQSLSPEAQVTQLRLSQGILNKNGKAPLSHLNSLNARG